MRVDLPAPETKAGTVPSVRQPIIINGERLYGAHGSPALGENQDDVLNDPTGARGPEAARRQISDFGQFGGYHRLCEALHRLEKPLGRGDRRGLVATADRLDRLGMRQRDRHVGRLEMGEIEAA